MTSTNAGTPKIQPKMYLPILILQRLQMSLLSKARAFNTGIPIAVAMA